MAITLLASLIIMAAYFLLLYGGVGFIQDKKFFSSGPLITTVNDLVSVVTYYGFAWLFLIRIFKIV